MNAWVIIPTYNERENLATLLPSIFAQPIQSLHVVIVDDASPDGTGQYAEQLRGRFPALDVLHRSEKLGLASAYCEGFAFALERGATHCFEMDADWSHDPSLLPVLLAYAQGQADLVLGSRYIHGGQIQNWNLTRRCVSRFGNWYARTVLRVPIRDLTGGFKCFRRAVLERIGLDTITSTGYNFQIELTVKALRHGFRIREIPITFTERLLGRSKFHGGILWESMLGVWRLRRWMW
jgi:dolichol-phosphate mannosyltransferase